MKKIILSIVAGIVSCLSVFAEEDVNLSPLYEKYVIKAKTKRLMTIEAKKDINEIHRHMDSSYKEAKKEGLGEGLMYVVCTGDIVSTNGWFSKTINGFRRYRNFTGDYYDDNIILVYEDEIVEDNPKNRYIRFTKGNRIYRSCIFRKVGNKTKSKNKNDNKRLKENHQLSRWKRLG